MTPMNNPAKPPMEFPQILQQVTRLLGKHLDMAPVQIKPEDDIASTLKMDSLSAVEFVLALESHFGMEIPDEAVEGARTVEDIARRVEEMLLAQGRVADHAKPDLDAGSQASESEHEQGALTVRSAGTLLVDACHSASRSAGWWKSEGMDLCVEIKRSSMLSGALVAQKLCLIHREISEAMEGHRKGLKDDKLKHRPMIEVELADALIRICDLAGALGLDLGGAVEEKLAYNATRADHKPEARNASGGKSY
jgi:acyl carrier protein